MRDLLVADTADLAAFRVQLESALRATGPAILPVSSSVLARGGAEPAPTQVHDRVAVVVETSGSTAAPKRVCLSAEALIASARATHARLGGPGQWLLAVPAHYIAGLQVLVRSLDAQIEPAIAIYPAFTPQGFVDSLDLLTHQRRYASLVPAQLARVVELAEQSSDARRAVARLDALLVGGQALSASLSERATALGFSLVRSYGSTETSGGCVYDGVPLEGVRMGLEESGELRITGNILALEYTEERLTDDRFVERDGQRWYLTGDDAEITGGVLTILGRRNRTVISGGIKVSLDGIDAIASEVTPARLASVAVHSEAWGERPVLVIEGTPDESREDAIRALVLERFGKVAVPERILWVDALPMGSTGKPDLAAIARFASA